MKYVKIYKLQSDGTKKVVATCKFINEEIMCEGEKMFVGNLKKGGIYDYSCSPRRKIFLKDGLKFLEQLKYNFRSGYLYASEVKEGEFM